MGLGTSASAGAASRRAALVVPGGLSAVTGGNLYDRAAIDELERRGWSVEVIEPGREAIRFDAVVVDSLALRHGPPRTEAAIVALLHQLPSEAAGRPEWKDAEADTLRAAALVVTVSAGLAAAVRLLAPVEAVVIPPGWNGAVAARRSARPDLVLCVANAYPGKGLPDAVDAYGFAGPIGVGLVVVGDVDFNQAEGRAVRAAFERCPHPVRVAGILPPRELARLYARAVVFLTASRYEAWPIAVGEAMASGVPVVAFDTPGVRELVRAGRDGALVPEGDVEALGATLAEVATDREAARRMGLAARRRARRWPTWDRTTRRFAEELERVALKPRDPHTLRTPRATRTP